MIVHKSMKECGAGHRYRWVLTMVTDGCMGTKGSRAKKCLVSNPWRVNGIAASTEVLYEQLMNAFYLSRTEISHFFAPSNFRPPLDFLSFI